MSEFDEELRTMQEAMQAVRGNLQDLQHEQNATSRELTQVKGTVGTLAETVGSLAGMVQSLVRVVQDMAVSVQALMTTVDSLHGRSLRMEASLSALGQGFASMQDVITRLLADHERVTQLEAQEKATQASLADLARRVENLEKKAS